MPMRVFRVKPDRGRRFMVGAWACVSRFNIRTLGSYTPHQTILLRVVFFLGLYGFNLSEQRVVDQICDLSQRVLLELGLRKLPL
jgi:hypothetical protein